MEKHNMNILYCGNDKIEEGLTLSILSLLRNVRETLHIYVLTMHIHTADKDYDPISGQLITYLDDLARQHNPDNFVHSFDTTELFRSHLPAANMATRFTPYCMLRLFADLIPGLPEKLLYLDTDVICRRDLCGFYHQDLSGYEIAGVLDYYGRWFFRRHPMRADYLNSGVLLMNLGEIRQTGLLQKCRQICAGKKMFMPDQSALNKAAASKKLQPRRFNEQRRLREDTVLQHFTTTFRLFPHLHTLTVKPWQIDKMHEQLNLHEYDDLFTEYLHLQPDIKATKIRE